MKPYLLFLLSFLLILPLRAEEEVKSVNVESVKAEATETKNVESVKAEATETKTENAAETNVKATAEPETTTEPEPRFTGKCYECVSVNDANCTENPPEKYLVDCTEEEYRPSTNGFPKSDPKGCRKTVQEVPNGTRIIRECAYSGEVVSGFKRTGNKGVRMWYYHCESDACNGASGKTFFVALLALFCFVALLNGLS